MNWLRREGIGHFLNDAGLTGRGAFFGETDPRLRNAFLASWRGRELLIADSSGPPPASARFRVSTAALGAIDAGSLDFVHLDAEATTTSLADRARLVKPGGLLAGHGYGGAVKSRVDELAQGLGFAAGFTAHDPDPPDWFLRMPNGSPPRAEQITVLTAYDPGYASVGDISRPNKEAYCRRHGYRFVCRTDGFAPDRPAAWSKLRFIREELQTAEWVFWNDADALVMNSAVPLSQFCWDSHDLILSGDPYHGMNLGGWFARRSDWTFDFLDRIEAMTECRDHIWWENGAVFAAYASDPAVRGRVALLPNALFNGYPYPGGGYEAGGFLVHFPGMDRTRREAAMREYAARAV
jgi:hypothetical protein